MAELGLFLLRAYLKPQERLAATMMAGLKGIHCALDRDSVWDKGIPRLLEQGSGLALGLWMNPKFVLASLVMASMPGLSENGKRGMQLIGRALTDMYMGVELYSYWKAPVVHFAFDETSKGWVFFKSQSELSIPDAIRGDQEALLTFLNNSTETERIRMVPTHTTDGQPSSFLKVLFPNPKGIREVIDGEVFDRPTTLFDEIESHQPEIGFSPESMMVVGAGMAWLGLAVVCMSLNFQLLAFAALAAFLQTSAEASSLGTACRTLVGVGGAVDAGVSYRNHRLLSSMPRMVGWAASGMFCTMIDMHELEVPNSPTHYVRGEQPSVAKTVQWVKGTLNEFVKEVASRFSPETLSGSIYDGGRPNWGSENELLERLTDKDKQDLEKAFVYYSHPMLDTHNMTSESLFTQLHFRIQQAEDRFNSYKGIRQSHPCYKGVMPYSYRGIGVFKPKVHAHDFSDHFDLNEVLTEKVLETFLVFLKPYVLPTGERAFRFNDLEGLHDVLMKHKEEIIANIEQPGIKKKFEMDNDVWAEFAQLLTPHKAYDELIQDMKEDFLSLGPNEFSFWPTGTEDHAITLVFIAGKYVCIVNSGDRMGGDRVEPKEFKNGAEHNPLVRVFPADTPERFKKVFNAVYNAMIPQLFPFSQTISMVQFYEHFNNLNWEGFEDESLRQMGFLQQSGECWHEAVSQSIGLVLGGGVLFDTHQFLTQIPLLAGMGKESADPFLRGGLHHLSLLADRLHRAGILSQDRFDAATTLFQEKRAALVNQQAIVSDVAEPVKQYGMRHDSVDLPRFLFEIFAAGRVVASENFVPTLKEKSKDIQGHNVDTTGEDVSLFPNFMVPEAISLDSFSEVFRAIDKILVRMIRTKNPEYSGVLMDMLMEVDRLTSAPGQDIENMPVSLEMCLSIIDALDISITPKRGDLETSVMPEVLSFATHFIAYVHRLYYSSPAHFDTAGNWERVTVALMKLWAFIDHGMRECNTFKPIFENARFDIVGIQGERFETYPFASVHSLKTLMELKAYQQQYASMAERSPFIMNDVESINKWEFSYDRNTIPLAKSLLILFENKLVGAQLIPVISNVYHPSNQGNTPTLFRNMHTVYLTLQRALSGAFFGIEDVEPWKMAFLSKGVTGHELIAKYTEKYSFKDGLNNNPVPFGCGNNHDARFDLACELHRDFGGSDVDDMENLGLLSEKAAMIDTMVLSQASKHRLLALLHKKPGALLVALRSLMLDSGEVFCLPRVQDFLELVMAQTVPTGDGGSDMMLRQELNNVPKMGRLFLNSVRELITSGRPHMDMLVAISRVVTQLNSVMESLPQDIAKYLGSLSVDVGRLLHDAIMKKGLNDKQVSPVIAIFQMSSFLGLGKDFPEWFTFYLACKNTLSTDDTVPMPTLRMLGEYESAIAGFDRGIKRALTALTADKARPFSMTDGVKMKTLNVWHQGGYQISFLPSFEIQFNDDLGDLDIDAFHTMTEGQFRKRIVLNEDGPKEVIKQGVFSFIQFGDCVVKYELEAKKWRVKVPFTLGNESLDVIFLSPNIRDIQEDVWLYSPSLVMRQNPLVGLVKSQDKDRLRMLIIDPKTWLCERELDIVSRRLFIYDYDAFGNRRHLVVGSSAEGSAFEAVGFSKTFAQTLMHYEFELSRVMTDSGELSSTFRLFSYGQDLSFTQEFGQTAWRSEQFEGYELVNVESSVLFPDPFTDSSLLTTPVLAMKKGDDIKVAVPVGKLRVNPHPKWGYQESVTIVHQASQPMIMMSMSSRGELVPDSIEGTYYLALLETLSHHYARAGYLLSQAASQMSLSAEMLEMVTAYLSAIVSSEFGHHQSPMGLGIGLKWVSLLMHHGIDFSATFAQKKVPLSKMVNRYVSGLARQEVQYDGLLTIHEWRLVIFAADSLRETGQGIEALRQFVGQDLPLEHRVEMDEGRSFLLYQLPSDSLDDQTVRHAPFNELFDVTTNRHVASFFHRHNRQPREISRLFGAYLKGDMNAYAHEMGRSHPDLAERCEEEVESFLLKNRPAHAVTLTAASPVYRAVLLLEHVLGFAFTKDQIEYAKRAVVDSFVVEELGTGFGKSSVVDVLIILSRLQKGMATQVLPAHLTPEAVAYLEPIFLKLNLPFYHFSFQRTTPTANKFGVDLPVYRLLHQEMKRVQQLKGVAVMSDSSYYSLRMKIVELDTLRRGHDSFEGLDEALSLLKEIYTAVYRGFVSAGEADALQHPFSEFHYSFLRSLPVLPVYFDSVKRVFELWYNNPEIQQRLQHMLETQEGGIQVKIGADSAPYYSLIDSTSPEFKTQISDYLAGLLAEDILRLFPSCELRQEELATYIRGGSKNDRLNAALEEKVRAFSNDDISGADRVVIYKNMCSKVLPLIVSKSAYTDFAPLGEMYPNYEMPRPREAGQPKSPGTVYSKQEMAIGMLIRFYMHEGLSEQQLRTFFRSVAEAKSQGESFRKWINELDDTLGKAGISVSLGDVLQLKVTLSASEFSKIHNVLRFDKRVIWTYLEHVYFRETRDYLTSIYDLPNLHMSSSGVAGTTATLNGVPRGFTSHRHVSAFLFETYIKESEQEVQVVSDISPESAERLYHQKLMTHDGSLDAANWLRGEPQAVASRVGQGFSDVVYRDETGRMVRQLRAGHVVPYRIKEDSKETRFVLRQGDFRNTDTSTKSLFVSHSVDKGLSQEGGRNRAVGKYLREGVSVREIETEKKATVTFAISKGQEPYVREHGMKGQSGPIFLRDLGQAVSHHAEPVMAAGATKLAYRELWQIVEKRAFDAILFGPEDKKDVAGQFFVRTQSQHPSSLDVSLQKMVSKEVYFRRVVDDFKRQFGPLLTTSDLAMLEDGFATVLTNPLIPNEIEESSFNGLEESEVEQDTQMQLEQDQESQREKEAETAAGRFAYVANPGNALNGLSTGDFSQFVSLFSVFKSPSPFPFEVSVSREFHRLERGNDTPKALRPLLYLLKVNYPNQAPRWVGLDQAELAYVLYRHPLKVDYCLVEVVDKEVRPVSGFLTLTDQDAQDCVNIAGIFNGKPDVVSDEFRDASLIREAWQKQILRDRVLMR